MKRRIKRLFILLILVVCGVAYREIQAEKKRTKSFLLHETLIKLINPDRFKVKLKMVPPRWMEEQIGEDFKEFLERGISKKQVDATYAVIKKIYPHSWIVRYRIINKELYRYFPEGEAISLENNGMERAIKTLMQFHSFKDMDFILSYVDGVPLTPDLMPGGFYLTSDKKLQAPLLFSAKVKNTPYIVLIPDWRSLTEWWANDIRDVLDHKKEAVWEKKKEMAIWRGSLTRQMRLKLCQLSSQHPDDLDAKLNTKADDPTLQRQIEKEGLFGEKVSWKEFLACKYLPTLDGVCCAAPAFQWRLLSGSLTLKQESDEIQWFYRMVLPDLHYLPIKNDLSDLTQKIEWARAHDQECKEMAERACQFVLNHLMMEDVYLYFHLVMKHYSALQKLDRGELLKEVKADPRWVNIHFRNKLKKKVKKNHLEGYVSTCTPY